MHPAFLFIWALVKYLPTLALNWLIKSPNMFIQRATYNDLNPLQQST